MKVQFSTVRSPAGVCTTATTTRTLVWSAVDGTQRLPWELLLASARYGALIHNANLIL